MRTSKIKFLLTCAASLLLLTACGGSDDDQQTEATTYQVAVEKSFVLNSNTNKRTRLASTEVSDASSVSIDLNIDSTSTATRAGDDSSARVETDVQLVYRDAGDTSSFNAASRIAYSPSGLYGVSWIEKCADGGDCTYIEAVISEILDVSLGDTINLAVTWDEPNQKFIHTIGSVTHDSHLADLQSLIPTAEGFNFTDYSFDKSLISTSVRNINRTGDSGSIKVNFDNVSHDGVVYDDFDSETLDETKWTLETRDYGEQPPQPQTYDSTITLDKSFTTASDDDNRTKLKTIGVTDFNNISVDLSMESASTLTRIGDSSSARLEMGAQLDYSYSGDNSTFHATSVLSYTGSEFQASSWIERCFDGGDCVDTGTYTSPVAVSLGEIVNISVTWDEANQKFIHNIGPEVHENHLADLQALPAMVAAGEFDFSNYSADRTQIKVGVRKIRQAGESGSLVVELNKVSHDGVVYDDFNDDTFSSDKWSVQTQQVPVSQHTITVDKAFTIAAEDDKRTSLTTFGVTDVNNISLDLIIDSASMLTRVGDDSSARLETGAYLIYRDSGDNTPIVVASRLQYDGSEFRASSWIEKCIEGVGCSDVGTYTPLPGISLGDTVNISITWDEANQKFIHNIGSVTHENLMADFLAIPEIVTAGGLDFTNFSVDSSVIIANVRKIRQVGESGSLVVNLNKVSYDGVVYDDFASDTLDTSKWTENTVEN